MKIKNIVEKFGYRKLSLGIILVLILALIVWGIKGTHAYYNYSTGPVQIFNSKVGNFAGEGEGIKEGPLNDRDTDVNIIFYTQMPDNKGKYMISKYIPVSGYEVNTEDSNCYPTKGGDATYNSYSIDDDGNLVIKYTEETKPTQIVCRIYYDRDKLSDVIIYAYVEDETGDKKYNDKNYKLSNSVPTGFKMVNHECKNAKVSTTLKYEETAGFEIVTNGPNTCYAYFSEVS